MNSIDRLLPALLILVAVFLLYQQGKRQKAKARAAAAGADARQAELHATELERLVNFGQALGRSPDLEAIRDVVLHDLPKLTGAHEAWVLVRRGGRWEALSDTLNETGREVERARERMADRVLGSLASPSSSAVAGEGHICLPLAASGDLVGVMGLSEEAFAEGRRRIVMISATLLAICVRNALLVTEVRDNSLRDGLTGCFNRTHAIDVIGTELRRARRSQMPVSLIMFDIDRFKDINDQHGHLCGEAVLAAIGARMRELLRGSDLKCRYGGEEFLVLLPETRARGREARRRHAAPRARRDADPLAGSDDRDHGQLRCHDGAAVGSR
jgi:GGDEF domain-containing protein